METTEGSAVDRVFAALAGHSLSTTRTLAEECGLSQPATGAALAHADRCGLIKMRDRASEWADADTWSPRSPITRVVRVTVDGAREVGRAIVWLHADVDEARRIVAGNHAAAGTVGGVSCSR